MSMFAVLATPHLAIAAADRRYTYEPGEFEDHGGKLRRVSGGWIVGGGKTAAVLLAQRAIERTGLLDLAAATDGAAAAYRHAEEAAGLTGRWFAYLFAARVAGEVSLHSFEPAGRDDLPPVRHPGEYQRLTAWAPGMTREQQDAADALLCRAAMAETVPGALRCVAEALAFAYARGHGVSPDVEIGYETPDGALGFLRADAAWLAGASDAEIAGRIESPPQLPPFPHAECERRTFIQTAA